MMSPANRAMLFCLQQQHIPQPHLGPFGIYKQTTYQCIHVEERLMFQSWQTNSPDEYKPTPQDRPVPHIDKCLVNYFIPRWGLTQTKVHTSLKQYRRQLGCSKLNGILILHIASDQLEWATQTVKTRVSKMLQEVIPWVEGLPAVICSMRASPNRSVGLNPHAILTGCHRSMPGVTDLRVPTYTWPLMR